MRSDSLLTSLGFRTSGLRRLWVEDSFSRLTQNGFEVGSGFEVQPRMGPGLNIRPSLLSRTHVSSRRGAAILSYEGSDNMARFSVPEVRVKITHGLVQVLPSLRAFSVRVSTACTWILDGMTLTTPECSLTLRDGLERPAGRPSTVEARLTSASLIAATSLIAWAKPATIRLLPVSAKVVPMGQLEIFAAAQAPVSTEDSTDAAIVQEVARQFFVACGWEQTEPGLFRR